MKLIKSKKGITLLAVLAIAVISAVGAYAYWTTSGSGTGSATAGTDAGVTITGDPANGVYPGSNVAVTSVVHNSSTTQAQQVGVLHVTLSVDSASATAGCSAADFTYKADGDLAANAASNPHSSPLNSEIAASGTLSVPGKVFMADTAVSQDACKGATINLAYAVNNTP